MSYYEQQIQKKIASGEARVAWSANELLVKEALDKIDVITVAPQEPRCYSNGVTTRVTSV